MAVPCRSARRLALYASESEFFHEEELKLLTQLAGDIAFAFDHIDKQERLDYPAYYDVVTGLANRILFLERVAQYMRSAAGGGHKLAVGLIDLERFKNINDNLGRPVGDTLLKQVAEWLTQTHAIRRSSRPSLCVSRASCASTTAIAGQLAQRLRGTEVTASVCPRPG